MTGGCGSISATGTITVTPNNTSSAPSITPTLCINTALTAITHTTTGATGIADDGISGANGLPAGVSATWASNTITISGTPTASGTFNYSILMTGGCGSISATGTITVNSRPSATSCKTDDPCQAGSGAVTINITGGASPYTVGCTGVYAAPHPTAPGAVSGVGTPSIPASVTGVTGSTTFTGLPGNATYTFTVVDSNGCSAQ